MKYEKLSMYQLIELFSNEVKSMFNFKMTSEQMSNRLNELKNIHFLTEKGNKRYPAYYYSAVTGAIESTRKIMFIQNLIYCYEIDGALYTTYKPNKPCKYDFIGKTDIPNYIEAGKESRIINHRKNNESLISGFYYSCGKPYYVTITKG